MEKILIYTNNQDKKLKIEKVARSLKMQVQVMSTKDLPRNIGAIAGISKEPANAHTMPIPVFYVMPEVLIFSGLSSNRLDDFLNAYRLAKIEPIPLKAVVTLYNVNWSLFNLIEELKRENKAMSRK